MSTFSDEYQKGVSFLDVIIGMGMLLVAFLGIAGVLRLATEVVGLSKARVGAIAVATEQMEYIRSLPYDDVGLVGGIPSGVIEPEGLYNGSDPFVLNDVTYSLDTFIKYEDDDADGNATGTIPIDTIPNDYKKVTVEVNWKDRKGHQKELLLASNIVPKGLETETGGGTLLVKVVDASFLPVNNATVKIENAEVSVDLTTNTDTQGQASFPGAPTSSKYFIHTTKSSPSGTYTRAQTYLVAAGLSDPDPGTLTVTEGDLTSFTFQIDLISSTTIFTLEPIRWAQWENLFNDASGTAVFTNTQVSGGAAQLFDQGPGPGRENYLSAGIVQSSSTAPTYIHEWQSFDWSESKPLSTTLTYHVYYDTGSGFAAIPDVDLSGNSTGFTTGPVDLTGLSTSTYSTLRLHGALSTSDASTTPQILDWQIDYEEGPIPIPNVPFDMRGDKTKGTNLGSPVYKFDEMLQTDSNGQVSTTTLEWDNYTLTFDHVTLDKDVKEVCAPTIAPDGTTFSINPNEGFDVQLMMVPHTTNTLRISVADSSNNLPLNGATTRLYKSGFDQSTTTSSCGQSFFNGLSSGVGAGAYSLDVSLTGYESITYTGSVEVSGQSTFVVPLAAQGS